MVYHCCDSSEDQDAENEVWVGFRLGGSTVHAYRDRQRSDDESEFDDGVDSDDEILDGETVHSMINSDAIKSDSESDDDKSTDEEEGSSTGNDEDELIDNEHGDKSIEEEGDDDDDNNTPTAPAQSWTLRRAQLSNMLLDPNHDIHLLTAKTKKERCEKMWRKYAPEFSEKLVVGSLQRLLLKLQKGELQKEIKSKSTKDTKPFWTSRKESSDAYGLLYRIRLQIPVRRLTTEEVYSKHKIFQQYDMKDFKVYDKRMIKLTSKHSKQIKEDIRLWELQRAVTAKKTKTSRNKLFWDSHPAKQQLTEDTKSGKAASMKPKEIYQSQSVYQEFSLDDFRKHIYQEKYKQIAGPYWQMKRNKTALKQHLKMSADCMMSFCTIIIKRLSMTSRKALQ